MSHTDHLLLQQQILDQVLSLLTPDPDVLGILATGSYARGEQDAFSDLDLACYLRDEAATGKERLFERVGGIAPTLWQLLIYDVHGLYLFENGVRLDLDLLKPSDLETPTYVYANRIILHDPQKKLQQLKEVPFHLQPAEHPKWFEPGDPAMIDWFFWMFRQGICWAKRGAQCDYRAYEKLSSAVQSLAEIRTRLVEMLLWTVGSKDYLMREDPACAARMAQTYPHLEAGEIIQCAKLLLAEYEYVCPQYCQKTGAAYPARKVEIMYHLIDEYDLLA